MTPKPYEQVMTELSEIADWLQGQPDERAQEAYAPLCTALGILGRPGAEAICRHCTRRIVDVGGGTWIDPEATGDDSTWRETCDRHDTFTAEHEPVDDRYHVKPEFGLSYAPPSVDPRGAYFVTCPVCGLRCDGAGDTEDDVTKDAMSVYQDHFEAAAAGEAADLAYLERRINAVADLASEVVRRTQEEEGT